MIAGLLLVFQVAAAPIVVRSAAGAADTVPVVQGADGIDRVDAGVLARALRGSATTLRPDRVRLRFGAATFEVEAGLPFVAAGDSVYPLAGPVETAGARTLLPVQFVTDVVPRATSGYLYDAAARELRSFSTAARQASPSEPARPEPQRAPATAERPVAPPVDSAGRALAGRRRTVVVDAGHGGPDGGMQGAGPGGQVVREKDVTLAVARELQAALRARGIAVVMTRSRDTLVALADRGRIANQRRADLFISIHVNAANPAWRDARNARGFETYFLAEAKTEDERRVAQMENESVRFESAAAAGKGDPLSFIITDMAQNEHLRESSELAARIQRRLRPVHPGPSRGVKQAGFKVLVTAFMPAVLVEIGYGTNPAEAAFIASPAGQRQLAGAIADAAEEYLADYERRVARGVGQ